MAALLAATPTAVAADVDFERQIRPLLVERCGECHGVDTQESSLRLDVKHRALKGGDFGPVILPGKASESELIHRITTDDEKKMMPPDGDRLTAVEVALLEQWINTGATWPETEADRLALETDRDPRLDHWAWQPVVRPAVPPEQPATPAEAIRPVRNEIDRFVRATLAAKNLAPAPEADRRTLIRRLSFDLLGLPPTPDEVAAFVADHSPDAYEQLLDRLLASAHYGERWARHWLDIAHYADTHGFERDQLRPNAWRYRDWVIRAINADMPYDEFLRRQIAGDVIAPDDPERVTATGFLAAGPWDFVGQVETKSEVLRRQARADDLDDMVTQVMTAACGVTINCARCHDHKLDPVSQRDYYALVAVFAGVRRADAPTNRVEQERYTRRHAELTAAVATARKEVRELAGKPVDLADIVGGGDGRGSGTKHAGIDSRNGKAVDKQPKNWLSNITVNRPQPGPTKLVNAVFIPNGPGEVPVTTTGLTVTGIPETSKAGWDAIRNGPVAQQHSTRLGEIDYATGGHTILSLHANAGITFDLAEIAATARLVNPRFRAMVGYGGTTPEVGADYSLFVDGTLMAHARIGFDDGGTAIDISLPPGAKFLTLVATDAGNGIGHDQIFFGDARIEGDPPSLAADRLESLRTAESKLAALEAELKSISPPEKLFGAAIERPAAVKVHVRGNPETTGDEVGPGTISAVTGLPTSFGDSAMPEGERRTALAGWITSPKNPLTPRVIVNRLWHHHFGAGISASGNSAAASAASRSQPCSLKKPAPRPPPPLHAPPIHSPPRHRCFPPGRRR